MINIYQLFPRLFGNKNQIAIKDGTIGENGCGKFSVLTTNVLENLRAFGFTHIWLTGVLRHATLTDYSAYGIPVSHPSVVKGRAGSPYAVSDYYDVDPDLADDPAKRMSEFEAAVERIHHAGMKVIIDFVPNHLARQYKSVCAPEGVRDFGADDLTHLAFHPNNNFYYLPEQSFVPPQRESALYASSETYLEQPAKATGNDCFSAMPGHNDWYETVKLNYGVDIMRDHAGYFDPIPDTWVKMEAILSFWAAKGIDGFRVDMAEMVPVAFWNWVIDSLKSKFTDLLLVAEIYQPGLNDKFIKAGFDFLYDKVGLYNKLHDILIHNASAESITNVWKSAEPYNHAMLRFMENHDEPRLASPRFYGDAFAAMPAVALSAWMHPTAFMVYNGQECGETALGSPGFSGDDGRTTIFDYYNMPEHQKWMNNGSFDGKLLSFDQQRLREMYRKILHFRLHQPALSKGVFYDLMWANPWYTEFDPWYVYAFARFSEEQNLLIIINFHRFEHREVRLNMHWDLMEQLKMEQESGQLWFAKEIFEEREEIVFTPAEMPDKGLRIKLRPSQFAVYELKKIPQTTK